MNHRTADIINGAFECFGAYAAWRNAYQLHRDREISGVYWPVYAFYFCWGVWNLLYYPSLGQWVSTVAGAVLALGNLAWVVMAVRLRLRARVGQVPPDTKRRHL